MRGCLFIALLGAIVAAFVIAVCLPAVAAGVITAGLGVAGLAADDTTVTVSSDPPTDLLGLHADSVRIRATGASFRGLQIGSLELDLGDVQVLDRTAGSVDGRLLDVEFPVPGGGRIVIPTITLDGGGASIASTAVIPRAVIRRLVADAVESATGRRPSSVVLSAPGSVNLTISGVATPGRLAVRDGDLILLGDGAAAGTEVIILRGGDLPIDITSARVTGSGGLRLTGNLAAGILG